MKTLRRIISFTLALAMVLSVGVFSQAAGYSDVADSYKYAEAINLLSGIGIIEGYEDGEFRPENTITRAEAATIMVRVLGLDDDVSRGNTIFSDVSKSHWASGYINIATDSGIVNGFPEGTFLPDEPVTYEQMVKMVVCAIGHSLKAEMHQKPYPDGFIRAASDAKVTRGLSGYVGMKAPRGLVAQLIYNALEVEMMEPVSYSTGLLGTTYQLNGETLLRDYLEIEKVDAIVKDTYVAADEYDARDKFIELEVTDTYSIKNAVSRPSYEEGDVVSATEGKNVNASIYLGYPVTAYIGEDEDNDVVILSVSLDEKAVDEVEIAKSKLSKDKSTDEVLMYTQKASDRKFTEAELAKKVTVVVNGMIVRNPVSDYFDTFDVMNLVDNDNDNEYEFVFITEFDSSEGVEFVVTDIDTDDEMYYFEGDNGELELDFGDDECDIKIVKNGKRIDPEDIDVGDVITCLDGSRKIKTVYVSDEVLTGYIDEVDSENEEYYIDGDAYKLSVACSEKLEAGDYGKFYINYQGKIAYTTVKSLTTTGNTAFIIDHGVDTSAFGEKEYLIKVVTGKGEVEVYSLKNKLKFIDQLGNLTRSMEAEAVMDAIKAADTDLGEKYGIDGYVGIAKVKANSAGDVSEICLPGRYDEYYISSRYQNRNYSEYKAKRNTYGDYDLDDSTLTFKVNGDEDTLADAIEVGTVEKFFRDGNNYTFIAYGEKDEEFDTILLTSGVSSVSYEKSAAIVTKVSQVRVDGELTDKIVVIEGGKTNTYVIDPGESFDLEVGNIILITDEDDGVVSALRFVARTTDNPKELDKAFGRVNIPYDEKANVYGGMVEDKETKRFRIDGISKSFYNDSTVNYVLVDCTGLKATFEKGSYSDIKMTRSYDTFVVVRTYEDEAVDVFIFRLDADDRISVPSTDIQEGARVEPTEAPTAAPTEVPTVAPTEAPTAAPTEAPTAAPTEAPTAAPTEAPTAAPTETPTAAPTEAPTAAPTETPTAAPTEAPTAAPTEAPTAAPTEAPTAAPTEAPTAAPTEAPTAAPTEAPTAAPTEAPTAAPTEAPTAAPTEAPTAAPTEAPTAAPTEAPTAAPTEVPTAAPTQATEPTGPVLAESTEAPTTAPTETPTAAPTEAPTQAATETATGVVNKVAVDEKLVKEVFDLINKERAKANLPLLVMDKAVKAVTDAHGIDMATNKYLNRVNKKNENLNARLINAKVTFTSAEEILAQGKFTAQVIVDAWMKSDAHKASIMNKDFTKAGVSVVRALDGTLYWIIDFVK